MSATNLSTLKAKVRSVIEDCELDSGQAETSNSVKYVAQNGKASLYLRQRLIDEIALLMQRHEQWFLAGRKFPNPEYV